MFSPDRYNSDYGGGSISDSRARDDRAAAARRAAAIAKIIIAQLMTR
jgi:hypothetical protein